MSKNDLTLAWSLIKRNAGTVALLGGVLAALGFSYVTPRAEMQAIREKQVRQDSVLSSVERDVKALVKVACFSLSPEDIVKLDLSCRTVGR
jgi:hypothetical protein